MWTSHFCRETAFPLIAKPEKDFVLIVVIFNQPELKLCGSRFASVMQSYKLDAVCSGFIYSFRYFFHRRHVSTRKYSFLRVLQFYSRLILWNLDEKNTGPSVAVSPCSWYKSVKYIYGSAFTFSFSTDLLLFAGKTVEYFATLGPLIIFTGNGSFHFLLATCECVLPVLFCQCFMVT